jgi:hypothetical protein
LKNATDRGVVVWTTREIAISMTDLLEDDVVNHLFAVQGIFRWRRFDPKHCTVEMAEAGLL